MGSDFNGDGRDDILWRHSAGTVTTWQGEASGRFINNAGNSSIQVSSDWEVHATGDFDGDGLADVLWRRSDGMVTNWHGKADGGFINNPGNSAALVPNNWHIVGTGDFNGDGRDDVLWRHDDGTVTNWHGTADGGFINNPGNSAALVPNNWHIVGTGDFNGDGRDDVLWRHDDGTVTNWHGTAAGGFINNPGNSAALVTNDWAIAGTGDFNGDGRDDILWRHAHGFVANWLGTADGGFINNQANSWAMMANDWRVAGTGDFNGDGRDDLLWRGRDSITTWSGTESGGFASDGTVGNFSIDFDWFVQPNPGCAGCWDY